MERVFYASVGPGENVHVNVPGIFAPNFRKCEGFMKIWQYRKTQILKQFGIKLSKEQTTYMLTLDEISLDNWGRTLILEHLED